MSTRTQGILDRVSSEKFSGVRWILGDGVITNYMQSFVDETMKRNAEFQSKAGVSPKIVRKSPTKCCPWCDALVGEYKYPDDVPDEIYHRHDNCNCIVEFYPGDGTKQDVWSKEWQEAEPETLKERRKVFPRRATPAQLEERKTVGLETKPTIGNSIGVMFDNEPQEWFYNKLTDAEQMQIVSMQVNTTNLNRFLNDADFAKSLPEPIRKQYAEQAKTAGKALSKYKLEEPITVYRGVSEEEFTNTMWDDVATKSFKSTSYDENRAMAFAKNQGGYIIEYHIKPGNYGADVNGVPGANEKEFLINRGVPYKILSSKGNRMVIQIGD